MFELERTKKCEMISAFLTFLFTLLGGWGFISGGYEVFRGYINELLALVIMALSIGLVIIFAFISYVLSCIRKDIRQKLNYLERAKQDAKEAGKL